MVLNKWFKEDYIMKKVTLAIRGGGVQKKRVNFNNLTLCITNW